jgi:hypothetical protein
MSFTEIFLQRLGAPECSMLSGALMGLMMGARLMMYLVTIYFIIKVADKLAFDPLLEWIKAKFPKLYKQKLENKQ